MIARIGPEFLPESANRPSSPISLFPDLRQISLAVSRGVTHAFRMAGIVTSPIGQGQGDSSRQEAVQLVRHEPAVVPVGIKISDAVNLWKTEMEGRGCTPSSIGRMISTVIRCSEWVGWTHTGQVEYAGAISFLGKMRAGGWSGPTYDQAVSTLKVFGEFMRRSRIGPADQFGRHENTLIDLQSSGEKGGDGACPMSTEQACAFIMAAIDRHLKSRRAKGASPVFWLSLFKTGLRYSENCAMRWGDLDLDTKSLYTDPKWPGNKAGRRDFLPLNTELFELLLPYRETVPHGPDDPVFPVVPNRNTFNKDREAASIPKMGASRRKFSIHSTRKSFCTWVDATGAPRGLVSALARHAETLTEERYITHSEEKLRATIELLPRIWPSDTKIFSTGARKNLAKREKTGDTSPVTSGSPMISTSTQSQEGRPVSTIGEDDVTIRPLGPGRSSPGSVARDDFSAAVTSDAIENGNGHFRSEIGDDSIVDPLDRAILALTRYVNSRLSNGGSK